MTADLTVQAQERVLCTASRRQRTWTDKSWISGRAVCPDCGRPDIAVMVAGTDLFPYAKASKHLAPPGVVPSPYAHAGGDPS